MKQQRREYPSRRFPERRSNVRYPEFRGAPPPRQDRPQRAGLTPGDVWMFAAILAASSAAAGALIGYLIGR